MPAAPIVGKRATALKSRSTRCKEIALTDSGDACQITGGGGSGRSTPLRGSPQEDFGAPGAKRGAVSVTKGIAQAIKIAKVGLARRAIGAKNRWVGAISEGPIQREGALSARISSEAHGRRAAGVGLREVMCRCQRGV